MTTHRGYTEVPGNVAPDVPFYMNRALEQIDRDVQKVDQGAQERDATHLLRTMQLEAAAGFPNNPVAINDATVSGVLRDGSSASTAAVRTIVEGALNPLAELDIMRARFGSRNDRIVNYVWSGSSTFAGGGATAGRAVADLVDRAIYASFPKVNGTQHYKRATLSQAINSTATLPGLRSVMAAFGGATSANYMPSTFVTQIKALNPAVILDGIGSNDYWEQMPLATYRANLVKMLDSFATLTDTVFVMCHTFPREDVVNPGIPWSAYGQVKKDLAAERANVVYVDFTRPFAELGLPSTDPWNLVGGDQVHATDAGHHIMATTLRDALSLIPERQDSGWQTITPKGVFAHRPGYPIEYRVRDGVIHWRGGVVRSNAAVLPEGFQAVADLPAGLSPAVQNTGIGISGIGAFCMRYVQTNGELIIYPAPGNTSTYVMFNDMTYPLELLEN